MSGIMGKTKVFTPVYRDAKKAHIPNIQSYKKMYDKCDVNLPSTCFGKDNMKYYERFTDLPGKKGYGIVFIKDKTLNLSKFKND